MNCRLGWPDERKALESVVVMVVKTRGGICSISKVVGRKCRGGRPGSGSLGFTAPVGRRGGIDGKRGISVSHQPAASAARASMTGRDVGRISHGRSVSLIPGHAGFLPLRLIGCLDSRKTGAVGGVAGEHLPIGSEEGSVRVRTVNGR